MLLQVKINTISGKKKKPTTTLIQVKINTITGKNKHYYRKKKHPELLGVLV